MGTALYRQEIQLRRDTPSALNMPGKYNIVIIVMDTARADMVEMTGGNPITPSIANLAEEGTTFTQAYSSAPWTLPSHASLFTGTYPSKHGAHAEHKQLEDCRTLAEALNEAGYKTAAASNNAWISDAFGFGTGFETFFKSWQYFQSGTDLGELGLTHQGTDLWKAVIREILRGESVTNAINALYAKFRYQNREDDGAQRTNEWIADQLDERDEDPFFLFVNYLEPHLEYRPPREYAEQFLPSGCTYKEAMEIPQNAWKYITNQQDLSKKDFELLRSLYKAEIAYVDEKIGELQRLLEDNGQWEDTVFLVMGDHGENIGDHGLMDHQYSLYDTLLHVPLVITGGSFANGGQVDDLVQLTDIVPTLLDEIDINDPVLQEQVQGRSICRHKNHAREHIIAEYIGPQPSREAIEKRVGDPHGVMDEYDRSLRCIRTDRFKFVRGSDGTKEFYDLKDNDEDNPDTAENEDIAQTLEERLDDWLASFTHATKDGTVSIDDQTRDKLEDLGYL